MVYSDIINIEARHELLNFCSKFNKSFNFNFPQGKLETKKWAVKLYLSKVMMMK